MPEEAVAATPTTTEPQNNDQPTQAVDTNNQLANALWNGVQQPQEPTPAATPAPTQPTPVEEPTKPQDDIIEANEYLKQQLGFEDWATAKSQIEKWKQLQEQPAQPQEFKFENEDSRKIFEALKGGNPNAVYDYLHKQNELSTIDNLSPAEAIKMHIKLTNPHYKDVDIADVFDEKYTMPEKPVREEDESDPIFEARMNIYNQQVEKINRRIERDAFTAKDGLSQLKSQLVFPDIQVNNGAPEVDQKALEAQEAFRNNFVQKVGSDYQNFKGFNITAKDGEVELPISYVISPEELTASKQTLENFNINEFFDGRWFDEQGNPKVTQMQEDVYLLLNRDKVFQKIANESSAQRFAHHQKTQNNIKMNGVNTTPIPNGQSTESQYEQLAKSIWDM